jgi:polyphosphate kinase
VKTPPGKQPPIRDLSWLAFNARVLQEARDPTVHLYDRLRFLGIFSNNLDEFFRVRVATLSRMVRLGKTAKVHLEANPEKILRQIQHTVIAQQSEFDEIYRSIIGELEKRGIFIKNERQLSPEQTAWITKYFEEQVRTQIVPLMVESIPQAPMLRDKSIYLACVLGSSVVPMLQRYALIEIPSRVMKRFVLLPSAEGTQDIILLEDIVRANLPNLFAPFGFDRFMGHIIKVTRDAEMEVDNDIKANLIEELERGLKARKRGRATRFTFDRAIDAGLLDYLVKRLNFTGRDNLIPGGRIHNFKDFMEFPKEVFNDYKSRPKPFVHPLLVQPVRIMEVLEHRDVMLHLPYHSFDSVLDLLREAAIDPYVQEIKITCYRLAKDSKLINALLNAVRNGKSVTVVMEVRARFDEEANLMWKERLEEEGVRVVLGIPNMKVHAKLCLIKKREFGKVKHYGFISTGNFNESTARFYSDHLLMTSNRAILADAARIFTLLQSQHPKIETLDACTTLAVSPRNMRAYFLEMIRKEMRSVKKRKSGSIILKMNSLLDDALIKELGEAVRSGVDLRLIVRGIFTMHTNQKGFPEPVKAVSIVDEFLEHARVFVFHTEGRPKVYISSADWMVRNLDHRVEAACPIYDEVIQKELIDILNIQLSENVKARVLDNGQTNAYVQPGPDDARVRSQESIYAYLAARTY